MIFVFFAYDISDPLATNDVIDYCVLLIAQAHETSKGLRLPCKISAIKVMNKIVFIILLVDKELTEKSLSEGKGK